MGHETAFKGQFSIAPTLKPEHKAYLAKFAETRRMKRDPKVTAGRPDPLREAVGLPVGVDGGYFVGGDGLAGQEDGDEPFAFRGDKHYKKVGILDYNQEPEGQHGLWCCWEPTEAGDGLWVPHENKHYRYVEWLEYLIEHFLNKWGYNLRGKVKWQGEDRSDKGFICISNNKVFVNEEPTAVDKLVEVVALPKGKKKKQ